LLALALLATLTHAADTFVSGDDDARPATTAAVRADLQPIPDEVLAAAREARNRPLAARMDAVSGVLLDRPYISDPLGEGTGVDPDPLVRYDAFDCLTFLEEVLALSLAGDPTHAAEVRSALRYGAATRDYAHRRHFMELQWIPGNIADGWLVDTTASYGESFELVRTVDAATWQAWRGRAKFAMTDEQLPTGEMRLTVLSLETAREVADDIRPGSIILTVREDRPWMPIWVSHVSFVLPRDDEPRMRHTTKMGTGRSRDHSLKWYVDHIATYSNWPAVGISILEPVEQGPRRIEVIP